MDDGILRRLLPLLDYEPVDFYDELGFRRLTRKLDELERERPEAHRVTTPYYPAGSWGPPEADEMLARDGRRWHQP